MNKPFFSIKRNVVFTAFLYTFMWGCAFPLVKICMQSFSIQDSDNMSKCLVAGIRFTLSGLLTLAWCFLGERGKPNVNRVQIKTVLLYGVLATSVQYAFTYIGLSRVDGSKGAIFDQLCVFFIILSSGIFFKNDRLTLKKVIGCLLGFLGVATINTGGIDWGFKLNGEGMMICAALCQTAAYFIAKQSADKIPAARLVGYGQLTGGIILCAFACVCGGRITEINSAAVISLLALAIISAVAYVLSLMPLKYFPASEISSFNLLITVFGVVMSAVMLNENIFKWNYAVSLALVGVGIALVNKKGR